MPQVNLDQLFKSGQDLTCQIIHGDVVSVEDERKQFGILSGDDISVRLMAEADSRRLFNELHMIFAMTDAPGVMTLPPNNPKVLL